MQAVILAGGLGTRFSEETHLKPKPMIEIGGKPILWHILKIYSSYGIKEFIICLGYKGYIIKEFFSNYFLHTNDVTFDINNEEVLKKNVSKIQPDIIFHLAAQPLVIESYENPLITWKTNVIGTLNLLEALKNIKKKCVVIVVTSDKVYRNNNENCFYKENDPLGGKDPYSASKAACEIAVKSWKDSFIGLSNFQNCNLKIATARAGNVIGGGDWSKNRLVPDIV